MENEQSNKAQWTYPQEPAQFIIDTPQFSPLDPSHNKKPKRSGIGKLIAISLCFSLLGGAVGTGATLLLTNRSISANNDNGSNSAQSPTLIQQGNRPNAQIDLNKVDTQKLMTPAEVYAVNVNSTVGITTSINTNYFGYQTTSAASGSGFILSQDGYILTNHHVIDGSTSISVSFYDGKSLPAQLVGYDSGNDIAVLKVEATDLTPVVLGDSDNMNVGDSVVAIGNPLGELTFSLTTGAVSALERDITISTGTTMRLLQTDCAINSGNSGGPLFNLYGEVIGITNAKYSGNGSASEASIDNIGFAIPVNSVTNIVKSIIEKGYVSRPYIGVTVSDVSSESQSFGLPEGAAVRSIIADSPAEKSGLQVNDIITHVDNTKISGSNALVRIVNEHDIGDILSLTVYRQGETIKISIKIGEQIQSANEQQNTNQFGNQPSPSW